MTDQFGQQPPPPQPGQQPTPGSTPPPPPPGMYPPQGAGAYPPQAPIPQQVPQSPPKKKRTGLIIGIVLGILALCGAGALAVGISVVSADAEQKKLVATSEAHLSAALGHAKAIMGSTDKGASSPAGLTTVAADAQKKLQSGRDEVAKATGSAEQLKESQGRTDYLSSMKSLMEVFDALQGGVTYLGTLSGVLSKVEEGGRLISSGSDATNAAISAGNSSKYTTMRQKATSAKASFTKAAALFRQAHAIEPTAGLDKLAKYCDKRKQEADVVIRMAGEGKAGRVSAYNADIKKQKALFNAAQAIGAQTNTSDTKWLEARFAQYVDKAQAAAEKADTLREKALKELGYTQ
jgi:hypothetical protein